MKYCFVFFQIFNQILVVRGSFIEYYFLVKILLILSWFLISLMFWFSELTYDFMLAIRFLILKSLLWRFKCISYFICTKHEEFYHFDTYLALIPYKCCFLHNCLIFYLFLSRILLTLEYFVDKNREIIGFKFKISEILTVSL